MQDFIKDTASVLVLLTFYINILQTTIGMEVKTERDLATTLTSRHSYKIVGSLSFIYYCLQYFPPENNTLVTYINIFYAILFAGLFILSFRVILNQSGILKLQESDLQTQDSSEITHQGKIFADLHYLSATENDVHEEFETQIPDEKINEEFGSFELKRAQLWMHACIRFFLILGTMAFLAHISGIASLAIIAVCCAVSFGFIISQRLKLPEIFVIFLPEDFTGVEAKALSDNLTNFISNRGDWSALSENENGKGKYLRHKSVSAGNEFTVGDLYITSRLVRLDTRNYPAADSSKMQSVNSSRWSIMLWGRRDIAAHAAEWIGKVAGIH